MLGPVSIVVVRPGVVELQWLMDTLMLVREVFPAQKHEAVVTPCDGAGVLAQVLDDLHSAGRTIDVVIVPQDIMVDDSEAYVLADAIHRSGDANRKITVVVVGDQPMSHEDFLCYWRMVHETWKLPTILLTANLTQTLADLRPALLGRDRP